jgi:glycine dehydrogenase
LTTVDRPSYAALVDAAEFTARHIGPSAEEQTAMLAVLGYDSLDALTRRALPEVIQRLEALDLPAARSERDVLAALRVIADRNEVVTSLIGLGYSGTITPPVILRNVLENPAWYTAYTPYQPEISQGRLEAILNF